MARQKSNYGGGIGIDDRLTTLQESVLCHILSFLPTITSVATMSLVSHRWRHLWKYLQNYPLHAPVLNYPEFHSLQHLKFILPCFNSNLLLNVLEKCHVLQVHIIQSNKEEEPPPSRTWEPQSTTIPKCLKTHLTYIHIQGYQGFDDELTFAEYILRNGLVLETMLIFVDISMDITNI
ncbi:hypothetical protein P8452_09837 [Trifolium repens]|nr:hypothetical protein P8452_09837 [Trifolium repens]